MQQKSLENNLHVRAFMQRNKICNTFIPNRFMLTLFTQDIYAKDQNDDAESVDLLDE